MSLTTDQSDTIAELREQLEQERAYSTMLEVNIQMKVDEKLSEAENRGYQRGRDAAGSLSLDKVSADLLKKMDQYLSDQIPELLKTHIPDEYLGVVNSGVFRPAVRTSMLTNPEDYATNLTTVLHIPEIRIRLDTRVANY